jgi:hypothetical protein
MKNTSLRVLCVIVLSFITSVSFAGGRYTNPPNGLLEVSDACNKGLEAAQKKDTAAALEQAKKGRKIALDSYKEISTMPMEIGSSTMKKAIAALEANNLDEAVANFTHCKQKMDDEIAYYKKEGKL